MTGSRGDGGGRRPIITRETLVPATAVVAAIVIAIGVQQWIDTRFNALAEQIRDLQEQSRRQSERLEELDNRRWTQKDMKIWALELERASKGVQGLNVPDPFQTSHTP